ncbi:hypothetical protein FOTG_18496 [Fusarium oxysporum f. sp. vasinfectum 25433]|uniref:Uncharacterized protein n=1 Tax=Fusarium oxysporum f. sp. vasinfectum 25433 TaxID=1089449 RepID=X0KW64_FUSOX|nr:hypothetical protein FOTG_18496 [Fusarium oxysporum f. sp. vasinfectum 25433]
MTGTWDLARCFNELPGPSKSQSKVTILVDRDALSDMNPVSLKCHAQEQLFNRTPEEIIKYYGFMELSEKRRREETRKWYNKQIRDTDEKLKNSNIRG